MQHMQVSFSPVDLVDNTFLQRMNDYGINHNQDNPTVSAMSNLFQGLIEWMSDLIFIAIISELTKTTKGTTQLKSLSDEQLDEAAYSYSIIFLTNNKRHQKK